VPRSPTYWIPRVILALAPNIPFTLEVSEERPVIAAGATDDVFAVPLILIGTGGLAVG
jgi:hypothetical protein